MSNTAAPKGVRVVPKDGDAEAFDQLPHEWRERLRECPISFSATEVLGAIEAGIPNDRIVALFDEAIDNDRVKFRQKWHEELRNMSRRTGRTR